MVRQDALEPVLFVGAGAWRHERRDMDVESAAPRTLASLRYQRIRVERCVVA